MWHEGIAFIAMGGVGLLSLGAWFKWAVGKANVVPATHGGVSMAMHEISGARCIDVQSMAIIRRTGNISMISDACEEDEDRWRHAREIGLQYVIDSGEAKTKEEAQRVWAANAREIALRKIIAAGEAETREEALRVQMNKAREIELQRIVDRGEAKTLEEAQLVYMAKNFGLQKIVDRGEAKTLEEALRVHSAKANASGLQKIIDRGEAKTLEEAQWVKSIKLARAQGKRCKYPGVTWDKAGQKWRVRVPHAGKRVSVGLYPTEKQAAEAHDAYVREHKLSRQLHFP